MKTEGMYYELFMIGDVRNGTMAQRRNGKTLFVFKLQRSEMFVAQKPPFEQAPEQEFTKRS